MNLDTSPISKTTHSSYFRSKSLSPSCHSQLLCCHAIQGQTYRAWNGSSAGIHSCTKTKRKSLLRWRGWLIDGWIDLLIDENWVWKKVLVALGIWDKQYDQIVLRKKDQDSHMYTSAFLGPLIHIPEYACTHVWGTHVSLPVWHF